MHHKCLQGVEIGDITEIAMMPTPKQFGGAYHAYCSRRARLIPELYQGADLYQGE